MTKEENKKLADFFYNAYLLEKGKKSPDDFMVRYFQDMYLYHAAR